MPVAAGEIESTSPSVRGRVPCRLAVLSNSLAFLSSSSSTWIRDEDSDSCTDSLGLEKREWKLHVHVNE